MVDRVPDVDLARLSGGACPQGMPLYDSDQILDLCKRWASLPGYQREHIINTVRPRLFKEDEQYDTIVQLLGFKSLTELADPILGWRRLTNQQIRQVWELVGATNIH